MADILFQSEAFEDEVLVGLIWRRSLEIYEDATSASSSCAAPAMGEGIDISAWPAVIVSAKTPGGQYFRGTSTRVRETAPAIITFELPRAAPVAARAEGESYLTLSIALADAAGNELALITEGRIYCIAGALP